MSPSQVTTTLAATEDLASHLSDVQMGAATFNWQSLLPLGVAVLTYLESIATNPIEKQFLAFAIAALGNATTPPVTS